MKNINSDNLAVMMLKSTDEDRDFVYNLYKLSKVKKNKFKKILLKNAIQLRRTKEYPENFQEVKDLRDFNSNLFENLHHFFRGSQKTEHYCYYEQFSYFGRIFDIGDFTDSRLKLEDFSNNDCTLPF